MSINRIVDIEPSKNLYLGYDGDTGDMVVMYGDTAVLRITSAGVVTPSGATAAGQIPIGSGTALVSRAVSGDATLSSTGVLTVTDVTVGSDAAGDLQYKSSATALARLAKGTAGQVLVMNAGATAPSWVSLSNDVAVDATGATTIQAAAVEDSMILSKLVKDVGRQSVGYFDATGAGADTETLTAGARVYELDTHDAETITGGRVRVNVSGGSTVKAQGTLTFAVNAADTNTVTIDGKVYTFQTVLTEADGNVLIGASASDSIDNLIAAITLGAGGGTTYASATTLHATVTAAVGAGDTMVATAKAGGTAGNALAVSDTLAGASAWDAATLGTTTAGVDPTAAEVATALVAAINADASRAVDAINVGDGTVLLVCKTAGATDPALAEATANVTVSAAAMVGGAVAAVKGTQSFRRTITAADVTVTTDLNGTIPIAGIPATSAPSVWIVQTRTFAGIQKAMANTQWVWVQANTNYWVLKAVETQNGATNFVNNDTVDVIVVQ